MDAHSGWPTAEGSEAHDAKMPTKKLIAVFLLWLAFVIWNGWGLVTAIQDHAALSARDPYSAAPTVSAMILNFWALASALFLALNAMNPFGAYNGKRLAFGCMAVAIMTGRLFISPLLMIGALTIPPFWLFLVAPFGLMVSGIVADILLLLVVGTVFVIFTVAEALAFAHTVDGALLVHCWAGISRSTAVALAIIADRLGPGREPDALAQLLTLAPEAVPNLLITRHADTLLERRGALLAVVHARDELREQSRIRRRLNEEAVLATYGMHRQILL